MKVDHFEPPVTLTDPSSGVIRKVNWFSGQHVQFDNGTSCRRRDVRMFYGEDADKMLRALQSAA